jgi:hypothetical protein
MNMNTQIQIMGYEVNIVYVILCILLVWFIHLNTFFTCSGGIKEGFENINNLGANLSYMMGENIKGSVKDLQFSDSSSSTLKDDLETLKIEDSGNKSEEKKQEINIYKDLETNINKKTRTSDNAMSFFENTEFSPECCPSNYTTSSGCACMTPEQMKFLGQRGGNRTLDIQQ